MTKRSEAKTMTFSAVRPLRLIAAGTFALGLAWFGTATADAAEGVEHPPMQSWSFAGPVGKFDPAQLQRGLKVYREVCASCHSLSLVRFRNLMEPGGPGFNEAQVRTILADYKVQDGPNDSGDMFERPAQLSDAFPKAFPNEQAARAANGGAYPPDFSVLAKARTYERGFPYFLWDIVTQYQEHGPDYIHALLVGYEEAPANVKPPQEGLNYNKYFPGHWLAMAQPIQDGQVEYTDGSPTTIDQYGKDLGAFMMWAAEPHLTERKSAGLVVMIFFLIFGALVFFTKKKIWHGLKETTA